MNARRAYCCISCGETIEEITTMTHDDPLRVGMAVALHHPEPMDAACRLVFEALVDDQRRIIAATMQRFRERLTELPDTPSET